MAPLQRSESSFRRLKMAPTDPILGTSLAYQASTHSQKINLGVGAYRTEHAKPLVLNCVKDAEREILSELGESINKEYSTIDGPEGLKTLTQKLAFGDSAEAVKSGRIASTQGLSGTGSLRVISEFCKRFMPPEMHEIWISKPTWGNHVAIFEAAGLVVKEYPYYKPSTRGFDFEGMIHALETQAPAGCLVLLHACAHNPTGVDPTEDQWKRIAEVCKAKRMIPLMDSAYQGYASGSLDKDAFACRLFLDMGFEMFLCQSFAKNLGLYGERIGMLHCVCQSADLAKIVLSQLKMVIRPMYSSPPIHGALLVQKVLGNPARYEAWKKELAEMADRILEVRSLLRRGLEAKGTPGSWNHITEQIGMFSYTGLTEAQCEHLINKHHVYLLKSGRISLAGLNKSNVQYMVDSIDDAVKSFPSAKL